MDWGHLLPLSCAFEVSCMVLLESFDCILPFYITEMWPNVSQLQDQLAATANKEFDPLGPLPHGWGKYCKPLTAYWVFWDCNKCTNITAHQWTETSMWWFFVGGGVCQRKELTQMDECILFTIQQEQRSGRTQGIKGKSQACLSPLFFILTLLTELKWTIIICINVRKTP